MNRIYLFSEKIQMTKHVGEKCVPNAERAPFKMKADKQFSEFLHRTTSISGFGLYRITWFWVILFLFTMCVGCDKMKPGGNGKKGDMTQKPGKPPLVSVAVHEVSRGPMERVVKASTDLSAEISVKVFSRTANFVAELLVEEGGLVRKGDLMARLEDDIQTTQLEKAKVNEERARFEFERQQKLFGDNIISDQEFKNAELDYRQQKLLLAEAERELDFTRIHAPIDGTVTVRMINLGDNITSGQHLFDLVDFNSIKAPVFLPESELNRLHTDQSARVYSPVLGNHAYEGYIERISPTVDARSGTVEVLVGLREVQDLRPGMYVNVEIVTDTRDQAILIPKDALIYDADQMFVFRLVPGQAFPNRSVERVLIQLAMEDVTSVEPASGIQPGDQIIITGKTGLRADSRVRLPQDPESDPEEQSAKEQNDPSSNKKGPSGKKSKESPSV